MPLHHRTIDLTGRRFGRLVVIRVLPHVGRFVHWECKCDCGVVKSIRGGHLRDGRVVSCGCYMRELVGHIKRTHGRARTPEYRIWTLMKDRCLNKNGAMYKDWGARGITVCDRWRDSFEAFIADMGPRPSRKHELDRRDNEGPYSAENCRWVTKHEQANNKRNNILVTVDDCTLTVAQWATKMGVCPHMIHKRLWRGWTAEEAVMTAPNAMRKWHRKPDKIISAGVRRGGSTARLETAV